ncbi:MAG: alginate lyase family protein [Spiribacter salinus]|uniref:Alginate lyase family protein n=1 Tax=Spiribacter salinus TaxID=1335746 RepID=A0A540VNV4_9GAMM|nr:MAG: alginate lyase family protein [Spiribacter salinus]
MGCKICRHPGRPVVNTLVRSSLRRCDVHTTARLPALVFGSSSSSPITPESRRGPAMHRLKRAARTFLQKLHVPGPLASRFRTPLPADRGTPPTIDATQLRLEYEQSAVRNEPNTFVLYRIIGNDLTPRHAHGQSRRNLEFILHNEPALERCHKRWIVNRIVDPDEEKAICSVLEQHNQDYLRIPFEPNEYEQCPWDLEGLPVAVMTYKCNQYKLSSQAHERLRYRLYRHKINYTINNNGARNAALRDGRSRAKWVLPWDGNCFLTSKAWSEILASVEGSPWLPYFLVPMARILDNSDLLRDDFRPYANEEPQILFRRDAREEFDEAHPYGRRPKVELFWRLGVPGPWDNWPIEPWDLPYPAFCADAQKYGWAGWVTRLSSGQEDLETHAQGTIAKRGIARIQAVTHLLDDLDETVLDQRFDQAALTMYSQASLERLRSRRDADPSLGSRVRDTLLTYAEDALRRGPYSVVDKSTVPPSGDPHDYYHPAPYYWPSPILPSILPHLPRDGQRVPGTRMYEPESDRFDRTRVQRLFDDTTLCALAWHITGDRKYSEHAAQLIRTWFVVPETRMNPNLNCAQIRTGWNHNRGSPSGIIEFKDLYYFLDALRIIERSGALSTDDQGSVLEWLCSYYEWLTTSRQGIAEWQQDNNHGTYYDLQRGALAAYIGDTRGIISALRTARERLLQQFDASGAQPHELKRTMTAHYCCFNLQGFLHMDSLAHSVGQSLSAPDTPEGQRLRAGLAWVLSYQGANWPYKQIESFNDQRFLPIWHAWAALQSSPPSCDDQDVPALDDCPAMYHPHCGIEPFWICSRTVTSHRLRR